MTALNEIVIGDRRVGSGQECFIIAEAGVNHNGRLALALALVDRAAEAGADAVKFQTFVPEALVTTAAPKAEYQKRLTSEGESQLEMLRRLALSFDDFAAIQEHCLAKGILFLSSPFDRHSADFLAELGVPAFKIGSGEITNYPLLERVAKKGRPVILSTGMSTMGETAAALEILRSTGNSAVALLHCVSNYPAAPAGVNLRVLDTMRQEFKVPVGYSDHTEGIEISLAAAALGACIIEKHYTLSRTLPGPDHRASLEPHELNALVSGVRKIELALGTGVKQPVASELEIARVARKSIVAACDIAAGSTVIKEMLSLKRPGTGLPASALPAVIGKKAKSDIAVDTLISLEMVG